MKTTQVQFHELKFTLGDKLHPSFGKAYTPQGSAFVSKDMPKCARTFVAAHELYHLTDPSDKWFWRELKANLYPFWAIPAGAVWVLGKTLFSVARLKMYWRRIRGG